MRYSVNKFLISVPSNNATVINTTQHIYVDWYRACFGIKGTATIKNILLITSVIFSPRYLIKKNIKISN